MDESIDAKPHLWIFDSERTPLAGSLDAFDAWADILYIGPEQEAPDWKTPPDAVFFSAEIRGGAAGEAFAELRDSAGAVPLVAITRLRSLAQALSYFRAGAADYLSLPLSEDEASKCFAAALDRMRERTMRPAVLVELESVDDDAGEVTLRVADPASTEENPNEVDILSGLSPARNEPDHEDEPVAVDGLPIPTLWEELPCGLLVFDSRGNLVFSNSLGLELFGFASLAELQETLENNRSSFGAHGANHNPLPDNQWPQILAWKTRTARSGVISIEKPDKRRFWLRMDCLPHVADGKINRLTMTLVNLTGELPALPPAPSAARPAARREKAKSRAKRRRNS